jgi:hypothetical protein
VAEETLLLFRQLVCEWSVQGSPEKNRKTGPRDDFRLPLNIFRVAPNVWSVMGRPKKKNIPAQNSSSNREEGGGGGGDSRA